MEYMKELTVDATLENLEQVSNFVNAELSAMNCSFEEMTQIDVAIDEIYGNIAHYAFKDRAGHVTVRFEFEPDPAAVILTFSDNGIPFDPLKAETPDTTLKARQRKIGGLGIFMVKKLMDEVLYEYTDGRNILQMKKRLASSPVFSVP